MLETKLKKEKYFNENTSIVAQLAYRVQSFLASGGAYNDVAIFLHEQVEIEISKSLQYIDCFFDQEVGTCGITFLDTIHNIHVIGYSGTNLPANKLKDVLTDVQIVLGYPTIDSIMKEIKEIVETRKVEDLEIGQTIQKKIVEFLDNFQISQEDTPLYINSAVVYYEQVKSKGKQIVLTGHSLGGNIVMVVALTVNHSFSITYNSAPLYIKDEKGTFVEKINKLIPRFTGIVLRFVSRDDPLNIISENMEGTYIGEKIIVEQQGFHAMMNFFTEKSQKKIVNEIEKANSILLLNKSKTNDKL